MVLNIRNYLVSSHNDIHGGGSKYSQSQQSGAYSSGMNAHPSSRPTSESTGAYQLSQIIKYSLQAEGNGKQLQDYKGNGRKS